MSNCNICRTYLTNNNKSTAHKSLCKKCYSDTTLYTRYVRSDNKTIKHYKHISRMNVIFDLNELDGRYVPKAYKDKGRYIR